MVIFFTIAVGILEARRIVGYQLNIFLLSVESFCKIKCFRLVVFFFLSYYLSGYPVYISVTELHVSYMPCTELHQPRKRCVVVLLCRPNNLTDWLGECV